MVIPDCGALYVTYRAETEAEDDSNTPGSMNAIHYPTQDNHSKV